MSASLCENQKIGDGLSLNPALNYHLNSSSVKQLVWRNCPIQLSVLLQSSFNIMPSLIVMALTTAGGMTCS